MCVCVCAFFFFFLSSFSSFFFVCTCSNSCIEVTSDSTTGKKNYFAIFSSPSLWPTDISRTLAYLEDFPLFLTALDRGALWIIKMAAIRRGSIQRLRIQLVRKNACVNIINSLTAWPAVFDRRIWQGFVKILEIKGNQKVVKKYIGEFWMRLKIKPTE